jgi:hypothetical protein
VILHERDDSQSSLDVRPPRSWQIVGLSFIALALVHVAWIAGLSRGKTAQKCHAEMFPVEAAEFVSRERLPGPLFNDFDWGGYLIWALPDYPVSIDGRTNLYGEKRLERSMDTWNAEAGWENDPDLAKARVVIAPKKRSGQATPLTERLRGSPEWEKRFEDNTAVVFVRIKAHLP